MCKINEEIRRASLREDEAYDPTTGHKLTMIDGDIVEMKYCPHCGEWHTLDKFYTRAGRSKDKLQSWCKKCTADYYRANMAKGAVKEAVETTIEDDNVVEENPLYQLADSLNDIAAQMDSQRAEYEARIADLESKLEKGERKIDLTDLSEKEIETVLSSKKVQPRMLFNALKSRDSRYSFFCYDSVLGNMFPIKTEQTTIAA